MTPNRPRERAITTLGVLLVGCIATSSCVAVVDASRPAASAAPETYVAAEEDRTDTMERRFERARRDPNRSRAFFLEMPKAGELHHHLSGAVYAETLLQLASYQGDCLDTTSGRIVECGRPSHDQIPITLETPDCRACDDGEQCSVGASSTPICCLCSDSGGYDDLVNSLSMRGLPWGTLAAHDHFFAIFGKLGQSVVDEGAIVAQLRHQAARENILYIETMLSARGGEDAIQSVVEAYPKDGRGRDLCGQLTEVDPAAGSIRPYEQWPGQARFDQVMHGVADELTVGVLERSDELLGCGASAGAPDIGCGVTVRLQIELHRTRDLASVCMEGIRAFTAANAQPDAIVGMNIVAPEDAYRSRIDYTPHMNLIGNLGRLFPEVGIALHAGELWEGLVPPDDLRFHMTQAIDRAGARRLGHGVSITYETDSAGLLDRMAGRAGPPVGIEINLVSNAQLLGVQGEQHPLPVYVESGVPVVLSTDDPGIMRTSLTEQFRWAADQYPGLGYADLRRFNRNVLEYSFARGDSIWQDGGRYLVPVEGCREPDTGRLDLERCTEWAAGHGEKAELQVEFERRLGVFEGRAVGGRADRP